MAIGATDEYWQQNALPGIYKHALLRRYIPVFGGKTGSRAAKVVVLDGYAGRGRFSNGEAGSAELIMQTAENQASRRILWNCYFFEKDPKSFTQLQAVASEYQSRGVSATAGNHAVEDGLADVLASAASSSLFLFLDPCGLGVPYDTLVTTVNSTDRRRNPTEILLNFSMDAVRRIGGLVASKNSNENSLRRLDAAVGGTWWRQYFMSGEPNPEAVVSEFVTRLSADTNMTVLAFPVRRAPHHKPVYYLVFATRSNHGVWAISDAAAKAAEEWRQRQAEGLDDEDALFNIGPGITINTLENAALPDISENLTKLMAKQGEFKVLDHPSEILHTHFGEIRNSVVRTAIKQLHKDGKTECDGVGDLLRLVVTQPQR